MVAYDHSIEELKIRIRNIKSRESFESLIVDLTTTNWNCLAFKPQELTGLFFEFEKHPLFNSRSIDLIVKYLPLSENNYSTILINTFLANIIENDATISDIENIYNKFGSYAKISITIARNPLTPLHILKELIYSDYISVIAAIGENPGDNAKELLNDKTMLNRVKYAEKMMHFDFS